MEQDDINGIFNQDNENNNGKEISNKNENKLSNEYLNKKRSNLMEERKIFNNPKDNLIISKTNNLFINNNNILSQNLNNSKGFVQNQINNLIENIEEYKNEKDSNINKELSIINNYGIIFKNMVTSQRCTWFKSLNKLNDSKIEIDLNDFNRLNDDDFTMILIKNDLFVPINLNVKEINNKNDFNNFLNKDIIFNYLEINYENYKIIFSNDYNKIEIELNNFNSINGDISYFDKNNNKYIFYTYYKMKGKKKEEIEEKDYNKLKVDNNKSIKLIKEANVDSFLKISKKKEINKKKDIDNIKELKEFYGFIYNKLTKEIKKNYFYLDKDFVFYLHNKNNFIKLMFGKEIINYYS